LIARALSIACIGFAALAGAAHAATNAAGAKEELRELKSRIEAVQQRIAEAEESKNEAADALQQSERAISDANRALSQLSERSRGANSALSALKREIERAERERQSHQAALGRLLYQQYVAGHPETLGVLLNGGDPNATARRLHYLTYIGRARSEAITRARAEVVQLEKLAAEAEAKATELAAITAEQAGQRKRLEQEKRSRAQMLARISREIDQQRRQIGTFKRDETRLTRLIDQLARVIARTPKPKPAPQAQARPEPRERSAGRARQAPREESAARTKIDRVPEPGGADGAFAQLRGRLALPVRGELASRFGSPRQGGGVVWKGLFIAAPTGEEVRAVAAGRVVYADWLRGFGNLLIIDHGDSYMSLYGYNETLYKQVGDVIRGGERVSAVGNTGGHPDSGLYFEMRHEGRPFDPMTWVSVR
jgi:septal ring factor EnvC (AmiA/AmiB activator)